MPAITGVFLFNRYKNTKAKNFIYFLVFVSLIEIIGAYPSFFKRIEIYDLIEDTFIGNNYWWYNIFWVIGVPLFLQYYYRTILQNQLYKKLLFYFSILMIIVSLLTIVFDLNAFLTSFVLIIEALSFILVILCVTFYFLEILQSEKILSFYKSIHFYISVSLFIWWIITTPLVFYESYSSNEDWNYVILKWQIKLFANFLMYSIFTFALIWCRPRKD